MTALQLLTLIVAALLLQLAAGIGVVSWRRGGIQAAAAVDQEGKTSAQSTGAWPGWREFRVAGRAFEDRARTQCSFQLEPVDGAPLPPFLPGQFLTFSLNVVDPAGPQAVATRSITHARVAQLIHLNGAIPDIESVRVHRSVEAELRLRSIRPGRA